MKKHDNDLGNSEAFCTRIEASSTGYQAKECIFFL